MEAKLCSILKPCKNEGLCTDIDSSSYRCDCPLGYSGPTCDDSMNIITNLFIFKRLIFTRNSLQKWYWTSRQISVVTAICNWIIIICSTEPKTNIPYQWHSPRIRLMDCYIGKDKNPITTVWSKTTLPSQVWKLYNIKMSTQNDSV